MGFSKTQAGAILSELLEKHSGGLSGAEKMVLDWCKTLVYHSDDSYVKGYQDGLLASQALGDALVLLVKDMDIRKRALASQEREPIWD